MSSSTPLKEKSMDETSTDSSRTNALKQKNVHDSDTFDKTHERASSTAQNNNQQSKMQPQNTPTNKYYLAISFRYWLAKYLVLVFLMIFVVISMANNSEVFTYENLMFFVRDLDFVVTSRNHIATDITYESDSNQKFVMYKGGIVVVSSSNMAIYNYTGRKTFSEQLGFSNPQILSSEKYLLAYDLGGHSLTLYNSFANIYSNSFEYPISGAAISDSGNFAVVTKSKEYRSAIMLYDSSFRHKGTIYKDNYVIHSQLSSDGSEIAIVTLDVLGGTFNTEIHLHSTKNTTDPVKIQHIQSFPLKIDYISPDVLCVVFSDSIVFYNKSGLVINKYDYNGASPSVVNLQNGYVLAAFSSNVVGGDDRAIVFDTSGEILYNITINYRILDLSIELDNLFILTEKNLESHNILTGQKEAVDLGGGKRVFALQENQALLCFINRAEVYSLNENEVSP